MSRPQITSVGVLSPAGHTWKEHCDTLLTGKSLVEDAPAQGSFPTPVPVGARVRAFRQPDGRPRYEALAMDATREAVLSAGLTDAELRDTAVVTATILGPVAEWEEFIAHEQTVPEEWWHFAHIADAIHAEYGTDGPVLNVSVACTSSLDALGMAADLLEQTETSRVLVVSAESCVTPSVHSAFASIRAHTTRAGPPESLLAPLSEERDGMALGEGAAAVLLETPEAARAAGRAALAEIGGWASVQSSHGGLSMSPDGAESIHAAHAAFAASGLSADDIDAVDLHATCTPLNDRAEAAAYAALFPDRHPPATAQKGALGHSMGASGLVETVGVVGFLQRGLMAPVANTTATTLQYPHVNLVTDTALGHRATHVLKFAAGFGGGHTAIVLKAVR
ncbi:beta-ketoacyl synthase N-terminal-like domain-containing protein [Streptomyces sp. NPDC054796]